MEELPETVAQLAEDLASTDDVDGLRRLCDVLDYLGRYVGNTKAVVMRRKGGHPPERFEARAESWLAEARKEAEG